MKTTNRFFMTLGASLLIAAGGAQAGDRSGDALLGGVLGGGVGAVIGQHVGGRDGAIVGGALGAATGVYATTRHRDNHDDRGDRDYRHGDYHGGGYRVIHARPAYYYSPPVYAVPRQVVYYGPRVIHAPAYGHGYRHGHGGHRHGPRHGGHFHGGHHR